jgi:NADPH:quinone reductase-like Zn-dependent oxidoreductase
VRTAVPFVSCIGRWQGSSALDGAFAEIPAAYQAGYDSVVLRGRDWSQRVIEADGGRGVDVAIDPGGGDTFNQSLNALRAGGVAISCGNAGASRTSASASRLCASSS